MRDAATSGSAAAKRLLLVAAILALAAALRLVGAGHDVPLDVEQTGAPALDAFWYLEAAQAPADGSGVEALPSFDRPLWVAIGRAWFALAGTGVESAQRLAGLFGVVSVLGVALALRARPRAALLGALLLATSYPFVALARTPLIYGPIAALLALALALHASEAPLARAGAWLLLLAVAGAFKEVALVAAPGFALADAARVRRKGLLLLGALGVALGLALAARLDPGEVARAKERLEAYLAPDLGAGVWRRLVLAPAESGLLPLAPGLGGLALIGATRWRRPVVLAALGWAASAIFGLALLDYRPLRFYALAGPPLAVLAGVGAEALLAGGRRTARAPLACGLALANAWALLALLAARHDLGLSPALAALAAPLGLGAALLVGTGFLVAPRPLAPRALGAALLVATLGLDLARDLEPAPRELAQANRAVREALGARAVLAGPYASALAAGERGLQRRRAPFLFGGPRAAEGLALVASEGLTHVALDADQDARGQLSSGFARLGAPPELLLALPVRGQLVLVARLHGAEERGYALSAFERACAAADPARALREAGVPEALLEGRARALERLGRSEEARSVRALMSGAAR